MKKVVTINLNGNAYQVDEDGFALIDEYLRSAASSLAGNPDTDDIMSDLEQAVADKFQRFLGSTKNVVSGKEVQDVIEEMGPVDAEAAEPDSESSDERDQTGAGPRGPGRRGTRTRTRPSEPQRLYRLKDEGMVSGICAGIGAYFGIDPTFVRVGFVVLLMATAGTAGVAYILLLMVIPEASTPEEKAAAYGAPFNAQEVLDQTRKKFDDMAESGKRTWRAQRRYWRQHGMGGIRDREGMNHLLMMFVVVFFFVMAIRLAFMASPVTVPIRPNAFVWGPWLGPMAVPLILVAIALVMLTKAASGAALRAILSTVLSLVAVLFFLSFAFTTVPVFREFVDRLQDMFFRFFGTTLGPVPPWL